MATRSIWLRSQLLNLQVRRRDHRALLRASHKLVQDHQIWEECLQAFPGWQQAVERHLICQASCPVWWDHLQVEARALKVVPSQVALTFRWVEAMDLPQTSTTFLAKLWDLHQPEMDNLLNPIQPAAKILLNQVFLHFWATWWET